MFATKILGIHLFFIDIYRQSVNRIKKYYFKKFFESFLHKKKCNQLQTLINSTKVVNCNFIKPSKFFKKNVTYTYFNIYICVTYVF